MVLERERFLTFLFPRERRAMVRRTAAVTTIAVVGSAHPIHEVFPDWLAAGELTRTTKEALEGFFWTPFTRRLTWRRPGE